MSLGRCIACLLSLLLSASLGRAQHYDADKIYAQSAKSVLLILIKSTDSQIVAQGTGFVVAGGKIVTNNHVVRGGAPLIDLGGIRVPATIESVDAVNDLAVLTVAAEISAEPLTLSDKTPATGSAVFAIGNPQGLEKSISTGVISGIRKVETRELLQITCPISPGSSGGPVFDSLGKVIGVAVGSIEEGQNLNFAIPASTVTQFLRGQPLNGGDFSELLSVAQALRERRRTLTFSSDSDSSSEMT